MVSGTRSLLLAGAMAILGAVCAHADPAPFDLAGPILEVKVTRGAMSLPISEVPNLAVGDRLWIRADLPETQSAHYLLVAAFLRGATNPPPENWFFRCETWRAKCARDGLNVTVPKNAQQVLLFLAPETGGDFKTLMSAVRGRPGAFVRASQDLNQATLDRARLEIYLAAIRAINRADPAKLKDTAPLLARSLAIKVDEKCLEKDPALWAPCLMQGQNSLILDDGHSTSIVEALTSGPASDLAMEASFTPQLSYGYYSPYVASVLDIARIMDSFHTAQYQYIPALAAPHAEQLALVLNTPPSFHNPKSVLVAALPAVEEPQLPPLHAVNPKNVYCARKKLLALPVEGAPLVFSTGYAHDMTLTVTTNDGTLIRLPAKAASEAGGFLIDTSSLSTANLGDRIRGSLHGHWGFEEYDGPAFDLVNVRAQSWELAPKDAAALIVGAEDNVHLQAASVSCVNNIMLMDADGKALKVEWSAVKPNELDVKLPLQTAKPGPIKLVVTQYGASESQAVELQAFSEATHLEHFTIHAGDAQGVLTGSRLGEVASLTLAGVVFVPASIAPVQGNNSVVLLAQDGKIAASLKESQALRAKVTLQDGRVVELNASVDAPRPSVVLIGKSMQQSPTSGDSNVQLANEDELPEDAKLTFSVRALLPRTFAHDERFEVATADESFATVLSLSNGGITLQNANVALATLDPAKAFGSSAFGPLRFRVVANGVSGEWQPLATLVRLPSLKDLKCPATPELACKLTGSNLYLIESVSGEAQFGHAVHVPDGFPGYTLPVPHPVNGQLYMKLRDDPSVIDRITLGAQQLPPSADAADRAVVRQAATHPESSAAADSAAQPSPNGGATQNPPAESLPLQNPIARPVEPLHTEPAPQPM
ncbi:MAG TPA: hypothetical protein VII70_06600 [Steroidobacteraceae bacterium]